ncbi:ATP-dependent DNA helicase [Saccharibacillus sp. CPCC 101409]|uniref:ATP-dependent DNA helicase n=1 Tax=Saccharibacillus sp. CPCC 101409 TaxID=3058041 RepID=UPI0026714EFB|nr:ATP-dependent DNA helicase [Saccharibacillus sp. CPCC 101409]MDO3411798.1 ATP-dependent DNA helicase [Saccharibacillus sp. CPCC 101409]
MTTYPFTFDPKTPFLDQASDWIADVFYDILPDAGFETRDEQIFMAFQLERAYREKKTIFAEAGVGTGKTLVYLLYAALHARYTRRPAVIACADESLIEQLVKPEGDIAKIARHLDLNIDVRLGKSQDQYLCLNKLEEVRGPGENEQIFQDIYEELPPFVHFPDTLQAFYPYGSRKDYPELRDDQWSRVGWDVFQDCLICPRRHRCGQTLSRDHYRKAVDLIVCSHDFYMEHVWTFEARKREGQLPLLPEHSSVVFDEGHLLETAAQSALTYKLKHSAFESIVTRLLEGEVRETLALSIEESIERSDVLFELLARFSTPVPASERSELELSAELMAGVSAFRSAIDAIEEEIVFESGMFSLDEYQLRIVEEHLEMMQTALALFGNPGELICWTQDDSGDLTLVLMPKKVKEILNERVFSKKMPIVFSSATLSADESFDYIADSLGVTDYLSFSVASPYDYEQRMKSSLLTETDDAAKTRYVLDALNRREGGTLLLFPSREEMERFRGLAEAGPAFSEHRLLYEGDAEISRLISEFQNGTFVNLCAVTLWEGLDVPGDSLNHVIVWELPFPPNDPVFAAKRRESADPFHEVDMPHMLLRLRQGIGRLIRTSSDSGRVSIFGQALRQNEVRERIGSLLPRGAAKEN